jgi:hypothetical protein
MTAADRAAGKAAGRALNGTPDGALNKVPGGSGVVAVPCAGAPRRGCSS